MRIISALSVRSDGTSSVTVVDYHSARVFRGRKHEVIRHTYTNLMEIKGIVVPHSSWRRRP
jgi:hypothetical protein